MKAFFKKRSLSYSQGSSSGNSGTTTGLPQSIQVQDSGTSASTSINPNPNPTPTANSEATPTSSTLSSSLRAFPIPIPIPVRRGGNSSFSLSSANRRASSSLTSGNGGVVQSRTVEPAPPTYAVSSPSNIPPIPSYDLAIGSYSSHGSSSIPQFPSTNGTVTHHPSSIPVLRTESYSIPGSHGDQDRGIRDYFGTSPRSRNERVTTVTVARARTGEGSRFGGEENLNGQDEDDDDGDDPLIPRILQPPPPNLVPFRRNTLASLPPIHTIQTSSASSNSHSPETSLDTTLPSPSQPQSQSQPQPLPSIILPIDTPIPPANALPPYSPNLARNELRLISTVHVADNHPAAAFFNAVSTNAINERLESQRAALRSNSNSNSNPASSSGFQSAAGGGGFGNEASLDGNLGVTTGGKRLRVTFKDSAERFSPSRNGPVFLRVNRGGVIEGFIEVGKGEGGIGLDISIVGLVNTSYYARGQYTLLDTLPIVRTNTILFPPPSSSPDPSTSTSALDPSSSPTSTSNPTSTSISNGRSSTLNPSNTSAQSTTTEATATATVTGGMSGAQVVTSTPARPMTTGKDPRPLLQPGDVFHFSMTMPKFHYRDENIDLPPSCAILQVGMQASVEYALRIKLSRSRWRLNESLTIPIIYEPRAYINPRRLRVLTFNDAMNPGWRTIPLKGGNPIKPMPGSISTSMSTPAQNSVGVECSLLLPTPPILFIPHGTHPPPIPFHLHFHSTFPLPLATFSNPRLCNFVVRLMRVATMKIGQDKEIRRVEIKSKVEVWGDDGVKVTLGDFLGEDSNTENRGSGLSLTQSFNAFNAAAVSAAVSTGVATVLPSANGGGPGGRRGSLSERRGSTGEQSGNGSGSGSGRPSFGLRRRSVDNRELSSAVTSTPSTTVPPIIEESERSPPSRPVNDHHPSEQTPSSPTLLQRQFSQDPTATPSHTLNQTDIHLQGSLQIINETGGPELARRLIQSFTSPEVSVAYVLEVGIQPWKGAIKEAFGHVWGGGIVELVLGQRE